jgi:FkbM family methyltransferase
MIRRLTKVLQGARDAACAIVEGDFFSTTLQSQLSTLDGLKDVIQRQATLESCLQEISVAVSPTNFFLGVEDQNAPEEKIIQFCLPFFQRKIAIDVGAHRGRFTAALVQMGFERIYAIEPHPSLANELRSKFGSDDRVNVLEFAVASEDGQGRLHLAQLSQAGRLAVDPLLFSALSIHPMPEGLEFGGGEIPVEIRSVSSLAMDGTLPRTAGLLKIDAEGGDLSVVKGVPGNAPYDMIMCEFWSRDFVFASRDGHDQETLRNQLSSVGYPFSLSVVRLPDQTLGFTANMPTQMSKVWGNTLYFAEPSLFELAYSFTGKLIPQIL